MLSASELTAMSNDDNNTNPIKTTSWAGQDAKIHAKQPTWSVGNYDVPKPPEDKPKPNPVDTPNDTTNANASYNWLLAKHLSAKLR